MLLIEASLSSTPIAYKNYPRGVDKDGTFAVTDTPLRQTKLPYYIHRKYAILVPCYAGDVIGDLLWERSHGERKARRHGRRAHPRRSVEGASQRCQTRRLYEPTDITVDAAMLLVDEALRTAGSTQACTRE